MQGQRFAPEGHSQNIHVIRDARSESGVELELDVSALASSPDGKAQFQFCRATVPANTTATLYLRTADPNVITEGGKIIKQAEGGTLLRHENGKAMLQLQSGSYQFNSR